MLLSCSELGAGLAWLQLQSQRPPRTGGSVDAMHEADVHALVRGLDTDGDGLLTLDEWAAAFPGLPDSEAATQQPLAQLALQPKPMRELFDGAAEVT